MTTLSILPVSHFYESIRRRIHHPNGIMRKVVVVPTLYTLWSIPARVTALELLTPSLFPVCCRRILSGALSLFPSLPPRLKLPQLNLRNGLERNFALRLTSSPASCSVPLNGSGLLAPHTTHSVLGYVPTIKWRKQQKSEAENAGHNGCQYFPANNILSHSISPLSHPFAFISRNFRMGTREKNPEQYLGF